MASKLFEVIFAINGKLSDSFSSALDAAQNKLNAMGKFTRTFGNGTSANMAKLQESFAKLNKQALAIRQFQNLNNTVNANSAALVQARLKTSQLQKEYENQVKQTEAMEKSFARLKQVYKDNKKNLSADDRAVWQEQLKSARDELKAQRAREKDSLSSYTRQNTDTGKLSAQLAQQRAALANLRAGLGNAGSSLSNLAAEEARLRAEIERTTQALERQAQIQLHRQNFNNASDNLSNAYGNFTGSIDTARNIMSPFERALNESMDFEFEMSNVKALTQMDNIRSGNMAQVEKDMKALTAEAKRLGATTEYTAVQAAQMQGYFGMAGWDTDQILNVSQVALDLATATKTDLPRMADIFSDLMTASGLTAGKDVTIAGKTYDSSAHFADTFAYAVTRANTNSEALFETMKYSAPIANEFGLSLHELAAANMVAANSGIKGSMAGTAMRAGLLRIVGPTKKTAKGLDELGVSLSDAQKMAAEAQAELQGLGVDVNSVLNDNTLTEGQKFTTLMTQMQQAMSGLSADDKLAKIDAIFGKNAATFWTKFLGDFDQYKQYLNQMDSGIEGWASDTAGVMRDNLKTKFKILESAFSASMLAIGDAIAPVAVSALDAITPLISSFAAWAESNPQIVQGIAGVAAAISGLIVSAAGAKLALSGFEFVSSGLTVMKDMITGIGSALAGMGARIMAAFNLLRGLSFASLLPSLAGIGAPLLIAAGAAAALAGAAYFVISNWSSVAPIFSNIGSTLSTALSSAFDALAPAFGNLLSALSTLASALAPIFGVLGAGIAAELLTVINVVANVAATLISAFSNALAAVINLFSGLGSAIGNLLQGNFSKAGEALINTFKNVVENIKNMFSGIFDGLANTVTTFFDPIKSLMGGNIQMSASGGGSFGGESATPSTVQAQSVQVQAAQVEQSQDTGVLAEMSAKVAEVTSNFAQVGELQTQTAQSMQPVADGMAQLSTTTTPVSEGFAQLSTSITPIAEGFTNLSTSITPIAEGFTNLSASITPIAEGFTNLSASITPIAEGFTNLSASITPIAEGFTNLSTSITPIAEGFTNLSASITPIAEGFTNLSTSIQPVGESFNQINAGVTTFNAELANTGSQLQAANSAAMAFTAALTGTNGAISGFTGALMGSVGAVTGLGSAASGASGAISGLGSAASSAVSALMAAGSAAASAVSSAASAAIASIPRPAANYKGGIYQKGAFLTTFAERSAEAAIPLDGSSRAVSLWQKAGQILGLLPRDKNISVSNERVEGLESLGKRAEGISFNPSNPISLSSTTTIGKGGGLRGERLRGERLRVEGIGFNPSIPNALSPNPLFQRLQQAFEYLPAADKANDIVFSRTQTIPQNISRSVNKVNQPNILEVLGQRVEGIGFNPSILSPNLSTPSTLGQRAEEIGLNSSTPSPYPSALNLHFEINIAGNANAEDVREGVMQTIPMIEESFASKYAAYQHEKQRSSFA